ncbi:MAG TPA: hypothetical protein VJL80_06260 [Aeromicrobium sp.]|nr:hypothetical protein [Aeromicrobium sp.]HKY57622.1 hypothetical protein [Aeromicrobium sp.]
MTVATTEHEAPAPDMGAFNERDEKVLQYLGLNPNSPADRAAVMVCRAYDLDAVLKHVVVIPRGGVYITRDGLLHIAHRSGQLDGIVVEQEPTKVGDEWVAKVSVYRKDMRHPFTFPGRYPVNGSNKQYAPEMALKAAEAHALRRAFSVAGLPTEDERRPEPGSGGLASVLNEPSDPAEAPDSHGVAPVEPVQTAGSESPLLSNKTKFGKAFYARMSERAFESDQARIEYVVETIGRFVESTKEITEDEARKVLDRLDEEAGVQEAEVVS